MMVRIVITQHTLSPDLWQAELDHVVGGKRVDEMIATCQQSCEQRDRVILIEQDKESASFSPWVLVLVHSM